MVRVIGTGLSGLVGSRIIELLGNKYQFENLSLDTGVDIRDKSELIKRIESSNAGIVLHMAAKADVDGCEKDSSLGEKGDAWKINVLGTQNVVDACKTRGKKIIYISTDFVFDGKKPLAQAYSEEDKPQPLNWYGRTKYEGEKIVTGSGLPFLIVRIAYPYRAKFEIKKDFVKNIFAKLRNKANVDGITDHIMTPTFIDDLALAIDKLMETSSRGVYHLVGSQFITPYEAALVIAKTFELDSNLIKKITRKKYFEGRAPRPFNLSLKNDRIEKLGVEMRTFEEGIREVKKQLITNN